jgi:PAS domain S-box-containing protein
MEMKNLFFCISIDASELDYIRQLYEESSTLYRALIENAFDAIYLMKDRHYVYVNPRFCELTGYTAEELTSEDFDFIVLLPEESRKYLEWRYQMRLEGKEIPNQYELELLHKSGKRVFVEVSTVSVGKPGEVLVMGIMRDITQRKIYEQQLRESEERLKELNAAKDKFFNIIAHDLRAPISGLISMTKTLIENSDILTPEETKELLTELLDYANQSFNLLENLLQWSRSQTGTIPFKPEDTDLYEIALSSVVINEPNAKQKGISISNLVPEGSISFVDRNMITTVVRNLISNAIKFTNPGGEIQISLKDNPDDYELIVADNGVGMDAEKLSKLFKIGENISTPGTAHEKGSGLGLILVKEFVEKNGGSIRVESEVGKGTRFFIKLPKKKKE